MNLVVPAVLALLISFNGLYVAAEFAAVSVRRSRVRQMAEEGDRRARALLPTLMDGQRLDRYIAACQVGITISSLVLGAYGQATLGQALTPLFASWGGMQVVAAQSTSAVVVLVGLTTLQMVLGELVPKSLALQFPTRVALLTVLPLRWSARLMGWFIAVLNGSGWLILRALRVEPDRHRHLHSPEEIKYLVAESRKGGHLAPDEQHRLNQALGLTRRTARQLMVSRTRVVAVDEAKGLAGAVETVATAPYTRLPVYRDSIDQIVGVVHAKDLAAAVLAATDGPDGPLEPLMRPVLVVHESMSAARVLSLMRDRGGVLAVVADEFGGTAGIVTTEDILTELVGGVGDEFKHARGTPERLADGRIRLPGDMLVVTARSWVGAEWESRADTVGGLVMERLGRVPQRADALEIDGAAVTVEAMDGSAVRTVVVRPLAPPRDPREAP